MKCDLVFEKEKGLEQVKYLVSIFKKGIDEYKDKKYSEAQLRIDFLNLFLKSLGWDVDNQENKSIYLRNVLQEEIVEVEEEDEIKKKNADYTLRINGNRKLFVEAKKVSIDIENSINSAFQIKRYGWSANLGLSILINFDKLIIYDCRQKPNLNDKAYVSRYKIYSFTDFEIKFDEIYDLISYNAVKKGSLDDFTYDDNNSITFDSYFLTQIEDWRKLFAKSIIQNNSNLSEEEINFLIQRLLNRIIFLRICEDRNIEQYETLKNVKDYDSLKKIFIQADKKYDSGLFDFIEDNISLGIIVDEKLLLKVFNELYYPNSPYDFSVVDSNILSQIYEKYLGSKIVLEDKGEVSILEEPETAASKGIVPTPKIIVDKIISETLDKYLHEKNKSILDLRLGDICCGSGTFLISAYEYLLKHYLEINSEDKNSFYVDDLNVKRLTLHIKKKILLNCIYGVDYNPYAVEVTKFSLSLKFLEGEDRNTIAQSIKRNEKILPNLDKNIKCGNSLLDDSYYDFNSDALENEELNFKLNPFNWNEEFKLFKENKGFDIIVGNPPYVRIQNLKKYSKEEIDFYQNKDSNYVVGRKDSVDKYYFFIERALNLLNNKGILGYIVPNKFFIVKGGSVLRDYILKKSSISKIINFGITQVFKGRSTYTTIIILDKENKNKFTLSRIKSLQELYEEPRLQDFNLEDFSSEPWVFIPENLKTLISKIKTSNVEELGKISDISVGLQTSADDIYIFNNYKNFKDYIQIEKNGKTWKIEKSILKEALYDQKITLFSKPKSNALMIFPYEISNNNARVFNEEEMKSQFPFCWEYLKANQIRLENRSINGSKDIKWYQYGRTQSLIKFHNSQKIIWSVLSTQAAYGFDDSNLQFTGGGNGPYYSILKNTEYSLFYILGILSHPIIEKMVKMSSSEFRGSYYSHGKQFIDKIPVPKIDFDNLSLKKQYCSIEMFVKNMIELQEKINNINIPNQRKILIRKYDYLFSKLVTKINSLYNLSDEEVMSALEDNEDIGVENE